MNVDFVIKIGAFKLPPEVLSPTLFSDVNITERQSAFYSAALRLRLIRNLTRAAGPGYITIAPLVLHSIRSPVLGAAPHELRVMINFLNIIHPSFCKYRLDIFQITRDPHPRQARQKIFSISFRSQTRIQDCDHAAVGFASDQPADSLLQ